MLAYDFMYDNEKLSDKGFIICSFNGGKSDNVSSGSEITFNTVSTLNGAKWELSSIEYKDCLTATIEIMKDPCLDINNLEITTEEIRGIMRWLNRNTFHEFRIINDEYRGFYFNGSFDKIERIELNGVTYGLELNLITDRPFAIQDFIEFENTGEENDWSFTINDVSDAEGYIYPNMEITLARDGDLEITNSINDVDMIIKDCTSGEVITINYPIIVSSNLNHLIQNSFNWQFFRIENNYHDNENIVTVSLPCTIKMKYSPIVKVGLI